MPLRRWARGGRRLFGMHAHSDIRTEQGAVFAGFQSGRHDFSCRVFMTALSLTDAASRSVRM